ncbi:MAG: DUF6279 family lipoprotein [Rhodoferax sp.]|nr:DUF6279 family lipoprotein [Rhodoferax sp.]
MFVSVRRVLRHLRSFHLISALLALTTALVLTGCSAAKLAYNNAPDLSYWWIDSYLDLGDAQGAKLRTDLATLHGWHRQNELPLYIGTLENLRRLAPDNVTPEQACNLGEGLKARYQNLLNQAEPALLSLAQNTKAEQLAHLKQKFEKHNKKWRAEWMEGSSTDRTARRQKQLVDRIEMLYGRIEAPQLAVLRASLANSGFDADWRYREMVRRQQDTLATLRQVVDGQLNEPALKAQVRALTASTIESPDPGYRDYSTKMTLESCRTLAEMHNSTNPAQRRTLIDKLQAYETDARILAAVGR